MLEKENPFSLPCDEEVFRMREEEGKRRSREKEDARRLPIWKKTVQSQEHSSAVRVKKLLAETKIPQVEDDKRMRQVRAIVSETRATVAQERRQEKENMAEFIAKKREMFLVQMSLDTKREEIRKLEEKAQLKEEALKKSEEMLEEDAIRFDTFLKENDKKAHDAMKRAERETKLKTDKAQDIKRLNQQIQMVTTDMAKHKEALEDCLKYKHFLDALTPDEWFHPQTKTSTTLSDKEGPKTQKIKKNSIEEEEKEEKEGKKKTSASTAAAPPSTKRNNRRPSEYASQHRPPRPPSSTSSSTTTTPSNALEDQRPNPTVNQMSSIEKTIKKNNEYKENNEQDEVPMYFTHPQQLQDVFTQLEEQNLFLIQNSQETERALEELKQHMEVTKNEMDGKTSVLAQNINDLEEQILAENKKASQLRGRLEARVGLETQNRQEKLLSHLHSKVKEVYKTCSFDLTSQPSTLFMLSELEARLEQLLEHIDNMPEQYVIKEEKDKEKKRRERKRQEQQALQDAQQEERNRKSIERSLQAPKKRTGRPVMFRSAPFRPTVAEAQHIDREDDLDELKYLI